MCGRYTLATPDPATVRARFPVGESLEIRRRYNVAPGDDVLAVTTDKEGHARGELLRWGLVPSWSGTQDTKLKMINARVETVAEKPAFRRAFERFRCLIVADGFFEWSAPREGGPKRAYRITTASHDLFAFAGLWSVWHAPDGEKLRSCAILTTRANSLIAPLHDRMPVILPRDGEVAWLDPGTRRDELLELTVPLAPENTAVQPVGPAVNDARYDGPECLTPWDESPAAASLF